MLVQTGGGVAGGLAGGVGLGLTGALIGKLVGPKNDWSATLAGGVFGVAGAADAAVLILASCKG